MKHIIRPISALLACLLPFAALSKSAETAENWVVYYNDELPSEAFYPYDLIVFDSDAYPTLRPLSNKGSTLLGYISLGEAESYRSFFKEIESRGLLLEENANWYGHYIVDVRSPKWMQFIVEDMIPVILHRGFDGVFLDTADSLIWLEEKDPVKYKGMRDATAAVIKKIRQHYPEMPIMLNRGFGILEEVAPHVDMILAESTMVKHDFETKEHSLFDEAIFQGYVAQLNAAKAKNKDLKIYGLDYWPMDDIAGIKAIYKKHREVGFIPYVSTIELDKLTPEPK